MNEPEKPEDPDGGTTHSAPILPAPNDAGEG